MECAPLLLPDHITSLAVLTSSQMAVRHTAGGGTEEPVMVAGQELVDGLPSDRRVGPSSAMSTVTSPAEAALISSTPISSGCSRPVQCLRAPRSGGSNPRSASGSVPDSRGGRAGGGFAGRRVRWRQPEGLSPSFPNCMRRASSAKTLIRAIHGIRRPPASRLDVIMYSSVTLMGSLIPRGRPPQRRLANDSGCLPPQSEAIQDA